MDTQHAGKKTAKDKILVALDVTTIDKALELVHKLKDHVGGFKVGLELCTNCGTPQVVDKISQAGGQVFLDLKFKDIPNTVAGASAAANGQGVLMFNVHCDGGFKMMQAASAAVGANRQSLVIGVTVLTSIDQRMLNEEIRVTGDLASHAVHLATLAKAAGLDGVVCSPHEVASIKNICGQEFVTVVPGVRPSWAAQGDQKRTMTPSEAIIAGADYLVIGRPFTQPPPQIGSPVAAAKAIVQEIETGSG
ncbi:MAG: orotidine-5'-phosphate decarboxylase, partial [Candidatus Melainabacteria bacterium]|nr:orotidine-5'-phosphate decarboxylase [Candidatus Melainabacteria bacterium]